MTTLKQIKANKKNSEKSTGPKDTEKTKKNAVKFGIFCRDLLIETEHYMEDREELLILTKQIQEEYHPITPTQHILVDKMIESIWRLKRIRKAETAIIKRRMEEIEEEVKIDMGVKDAEIYFPLAEQQAKGIMKYVPEMVLGKMVDDNKKRIRELLNGPINMQELSDEDRALLIFEDKLAEKKYLREKFTEIKKDEELITENTENLLSYEKTLMNQLMSLIAMYHKISGV